MQMEIGSMMKINDVIKVKYIGADNPLALRYGKIYNTRILKKIGMGL